MVKYNYANIITMEDVLEDGGIQPKEIFFMCDLE